MKFRGYNAKRDALEPVIVRELTDAGCQVIRVAQPFDLWVGLAGTWIPVEVKSSESAPLRPAQIAFIKACTVCKLPYFVIRDLDDVTVLLGEYINPGSNLPGDGAGSGSAR